MSEKATKNNDYRLGLDLKPESIYKHFRIAELVRSLKYMNDCGGCTFLLGRLQALANAMQDKNTTPREEIEEIVYLQVQIVDQVRHVLNFQDKIIGTLKGLVSDIYADEDDSNMEDFKPSSERLEALRSLENLFVYDNLGYNDRTSMCDLKTWCDIYDFDLEKIKDFLGNKENKKPAIESLQN